jgi:mycothiol synthase
MTDALPVSPWSVERAVGAPPAPILAELEHLASEAAEADGHPPLSEQTLVTLRSRDADGHVIVLLARTGTSTGTQYDAGPAGAAVLLPDPEGGTVLELVVAPDRRREGAATALIEAVLREGVQGLRSWSHGNHPAAVHLAGRHGFAPVRELWRAKAAAALPDPVLPDGVVLRPFVPGQDEEAWLAVNAAAFAHHPEQGGMTRADLDARIGEDWFDAAGFLLAVRQEDDALLAFHWTKVHPGPDGGEPIGEVYVVGVAPEAQGTGLGKAVTVAGIEHLHAAGLGTIMLYVDGDNVAAMALYGKLGFERWDVDVMYAAPEAP